MSPAHLSLVTLETPRPRAEQLLLRPVLTFVEAEIAPPYAMRIACRRPPRARRCAAPVPAYAGDLETWRPPVAGPRVKSKTIPNAKPLTRAERAFGREIAGLRVLRPIADGRCTNTVRPCPFGSCSMHLGIEVTDIGSLKVVFPNRELDLKESCALDVAAAGGRSTPGLSKLLNVSEQRAGQLVEEATLEMEAKLRAHGIDGDVHLLLQLAAQSGNWGPE